MSVREVEGHCIGWRVLVGNLASHEVSRKQSVEAQTSWVVDLCRCQEADVNLGVGHNKVPEWGIAIGQEHHQGAEVTQWGIFGGELRV